MIYVTERGRNRGKGGMEKRGELRKGKQRRGTIGIMTGWERHSPPLHLGGESGKSQSSRGRNVRSHFHVDKSGVSPRGEAVTDRDRSETLGVLCQREEGNLLRLALPLYSDSFEACRASNL